MKNFFKLCSVHNVSFHSWSWWLQQEWRYNGTGACLPLCNVTFSHCNTFKLNSEESFFFKDFQRNTSRLLLLLLTGAAKHSKVAFMVLYHVLRLFFFNEGGQSNSSALSLWKTSVWSAKEMRLLCPTAGPIGNIRQICEAEWRHMWRPELDVPYIVLVISCFHRCASKAPYDPSSTFIRVSFPSGFGFFLSVRSFSCKILVFFHGTPPPFPSVLCSTRVFLNLTCKFKSTCSPVSLSVCCVLCSGFGSGSIAIALLFWLMLCYWTTLTLCLPPLSLGFIRGFLGGRAAVFACRFGV